MGSESSESIKKRAHWNCTCCSSFSKISKLKPLEGVDVPEEGSTGLFEEPLLASEAADKLGACKMA